MGPEAAELNIGLGHVQMSQEQPETKDRLSEDVKDSIGNDFSININIKGAVGNTPDTRSPLAE